MTVVGSRWKEARFVPSNFSWWRRIFLYITSLVRPVVQALCQIVLHFGVFCEIQKKLCHRIDFLFVWKLLEDLLSCLQEELQSWSIFLKKRMIRVQNSPLLFIDKRIVESEIVKKIYQGMTLIWGKLNIFYWVEAKSIMGAELICNM